MLKAQKRKLESALGDLLETTDRSSITTRIKASNKPIYGIDLADPKGIVRHNPDGTVTRGHIENRRFIPLAGDESETA